MAEETQQPDINAIVEQLRVKNAELTQKNLARKSKIEELETTITERDTTNAALQTEVRRLTVDVPMRSMAESLSTVPELFIEQFNKSHRLEKIDGELSIVNTEDGKPINVPFEHEALKKYLTDDANPQAKNFQAIVIASRASGGAGQATQREKKITKPVVKNQFGLR